MTDADKARYLAELTALLVAQGQPRRAAAAQGDKGSAKTFLAIRVPVLRDIALRGFALPGLTPPARLEVWDHIWRTSPHYEVMSVPLLVYLAQGRKIDPAAFGVIRHWIDRVDDWGHCDNLSGVLSFLNHADKDAVMPYLEALGRSGDIWRVRASMVSLIHYSGKNAVYLTPAEVLPFLDPHLAHPDKYVANAVGWVLREMNHAYPAEIGGYVRANRDRLTGTALRKARRFNRD